MNVLYAVTYLAVRIYLIDHSICFYICMKLCLAEVSPKWPEAYLEPCQISMLELFAKIVNG